MHADGPIWAITAIASACYPCHTGLVVWQDHPSWDKDVLVCRMKIAHLLPDPISIKRRRSAHFSSRIGLKSLMGNSTSWAELSTYSMASDFPPHFCLA